MLDTAALYVERGYVDDELFMQEWGYVYAGILESSRNFMAERIARNAYPSSAAWSHFLRLAGHAVERELTNQATQTKEADGSALPPAGP
jgi:hypothetical protein